MRVGLNPVENSRGCRTRNESPVSKMPWSTVSKAAERSRRQRQESFCELIALMRWSLMYKRDVSVEW